MGSDSQYQPTDFVHAIGPDEAQRYDEPAPSALVLLWRGTTGRRVRCSDFECGTLRVVRERDKMLLVELDGGGTFWYPMRTTTLEEDGV